MGKKSRNKSKQADNKNNNEDGASADDVLSENHSIVDTMSVGTLSIFGDDNANNNKNMFEDYDVSEGVVDTDVLIERGGDFAASSADAELAASNRLSKLREVLNVLDHEYTQEKRSAKREGILRKVFQSLTHLATGAEGWEIVMSANTQILTCCQFSLRPGQVASEQYASCRVLEATSVVLGANEEEWVENIHKCLLRTAQSSARATPVRMAALRALAVSIAVCAAQDSHMAEQLQNVCEELAETEYRTHAVPDVLRASAWDCWTLLATLQEDLHLAGQDDVQIGRGLAILNRLKDDLYSESSIELRSAAGQCLALIHEARLNLGSEDGENTTARRFDKGSWDGTAFEECMDEVKQQIAQLSVESGHHMSKKAKKAQRATFREYMATIVDDEAPEVVINFRSGSLTLNTWKEIVQLNFIRHCLQSGFQVQLLTNTTLQEMFGADGQIMVHTSNANLSSIEKRLILSKTSEAAKVANQDRRGRRDKRENIKNHFLTADGEDL